jgi:heme exporter protein C
LRILNVLSGLAMAAAFAVIFFYAPVEAEQGVVQKIFYIHVACAITMYAGFFVSFLAALLFLLEKRLHWDEIAVSGAEVGFFLCTVVLLTGPIWAKPIWGAWWTWEPRLTTTFLLWLLYAGYLVLRGYFAHDPRGRAITSVVLAVDFLCVPLVHFSVRLWRGMHPTVVGPQGGGITPAMKLTFAVTLAAVFLLFCSLFATRFRLERSRNRLEALKLKRSEAA